MAVDGMSWYQMTRLVEWSGRAPILLLRLRDIVAFAAPLSPRKQLLDCV
jgi:hypothetical protein